MQFLDAQTNRWTTLDRQGRLRSEVTLDDRARLLAATASEDRLALLALPPDSLQPASVSIVSLDGRRRCGRFTLTDRRRRWLALGPTNELATLPVEPPFFLQIWTLDGKPLWRRLLSVPPGGDGRHPRRWVSLRPVWLEASQLLVTLSDLTSDARILVRIDLATGAIRKRQIQVPMAFGASDPRGRRLLAYREIPGAELAIYRWRSSRPATSADSGPTRRADPTQTLAERREPCRDGQ